MGNKSTVYLTQEGLEELKEGVVVYVRESMS